MQNRFRFCSNKGSEITLSVQKHSSPQPEQKAIRVYVELCGNFKVKPSNDWEGSNILVVLSEYRHLNLSNDLVLEKNVKTIAKTT